MPKPKRSGATAWDCALRYLGVRSHSRAELVEKLRRRQFNPEEIEGALDRLDSAGLINDRQFAQDLTRSLLENKLISSSQVGRELRRRGIDESIASEVMETIPAGSDYDRALVLAQKKMGQLTHKDRDTRWRRTLAFLGRRGFNEGMCYAVVRELEEELEAHGELG